MQQRNNPDFTILLIAFIVIIAAFMSSCVSTGYGCKGNSNNITGTNHKYKMR